MQRDIDTLAEAWLDRQLEGDPTGTDLVATARREPRTMRVAILRAAVARLPSLRHDRSARERGSALYALVVASYRQRLPFEEEDVVALLEAARHDCGHGEDVLPPLDAARRHAQKHGLSPALARAVRDYRDALTGLVSIKAQTAKRRAAFLLVLADDPGDTDCWSTGLRRWLDAVPPHEREAWRDAIVHMALNDGHEPPRDWLDRCDLLVQAVGAARVVAALEACWPPAGPVALETAGSHVLKNLVWLLDRIAETTDAAEGARALVSRLTETELLPARTAAKVVHVVVLFLARHRTEETLRALERAEQWARAQRGLEKAETIARACAAARAAP